MGQLRAIQALRAIAALFVVVFHTTVLWHDKFDATAKPWANGGAGVDLFFVISGFIMVVSSRRLVNLADGWRRFLTLRLVRIVPMYWLVTAAKLAAISAIPSMALHTRPTAWNVIASFLFIPSRDALGIVRPVVEVGWTLSFELLFYAAFACSLLVRVRASAVVIPIMTGLAVASIFVQPQWPAVMSLADPIVFEFVFGLLLGEAFVRGKLPTGRMGWFCALTIAVLGLAALPVSGQGERVIVWGGAATLALSASVAIEGWISSVLPKFLVRLGEASYSLYLTHAFALPVAGVIAARTGMTGTTLAIFFAATGILASVASSLVVFRFIETPITNWLRQAIDDRGRIRPWGQLLGSGPNVSSRRPRSLRPIANSVTTP